MLHFVGAGSGAVDLITLRGMNYLKQADVIIYAGSLVNPELLSYGKPDVEIYNSAYLTLDEVMELIKVGNDAGKDIVRLHTGDPSVYGAIREQMDRLRELHIDYDVCPGVTACFAAAASLGVEYTLPKVSQTLIISRMAGRTAVPERESIESLAAHRASMAIYLSTGMLTELTERLMAGGYPAETPAALVYKASWPEEQRIRCMLWELPRLAEERNITKTALVLVGDAIGDAEYEESRLYAADFETEFRRGKNSSLSVICFTRSGETLAKRLRESYSEELRLFTKYSGNEDTDFQRVSAGISAWVRERFSEKSPILFIGAAGIAVRAIADSVNNKLEDSPVLVMDELGRNVIPILSGHVGGANELSEKIADALGAMPIITTATDLQRKFAIDLFAKKHRLHIKNKEGIVKISKKVLEGRKLRIGVEEKILSELEEWLSKEKVEYELTSLSGDRAGLDVLETVNKKENEKSFKTSGRETEEAFDILIFTGNEGTGGKVQNQTHFQKQMQSRTQTKSQAQTQSKCTMKAQIQASPQVHASLYLQAPRYVLGFGCKKGKTLQEMEEFLLPILRDLQIEPLEIRELASVERKKEEACILDFSKKWDIPLHFFSSEELKELDGEFRHSDFVEKTLGVDNVCERAAIRAVGDNNKLVLKKTVKNGMTLAIAEL